MDLEDKLVVAGRPKGALGKIPTDLKELVLLALHKRGGLNWLVSLEDGTFVKLLSMIIPRQVAHSGIITGVSVTINTNLAVGSAKMTKQIESDIASVYEGACVDTD